MNKKVPIVGASGMIGSLILDHCLKSDDVRQVVSLVRRASEIKHEKLIETVVSDFLNLEVISEQFEGVDIVYYCLGVYTGAVDRETFYELTVSYPKALAQALKAYGSELRFCLLSGAGADREEKSRMMFAKDKGAIENVLAGMGFSAFHAFRPSYIYPVEAREEPNFSYRLMRGLYPVFKVLGDKVSIKSTVLAQTMFDIGLNGSDLEVLENKQIIEYQRSLKIRE